MSSEEPIQVPLSVSGKRPWRNEDVLKALYSDAGWSTFKIADELGCSQATISNWLRRHGIETRTHKGIENAAEQRRMHHAEYRSHLSQTNPRRVKYMYWKATSRDGHIDTMKVHRLLAVAEHGFDAVCDMHVHHKNKIAWDNRPRTSNYCRLQNTRHTTG